MWVYNMHDNHNIHNVHCYSSVYSIFSYSKHMGQFLQDRENCHCVSLFLNISSGETSQDHFFINSFCGKNCAKITLYDYIIFMAIYFLWQDNFLGPDVRDPIDKDQLTNQIYFFRFGHTKTSNKKVHGTAIFPADTNPYILFMKDINSYSSSFNLGVLNPWGSPFWNKVFESLFR